MIILNKNKLFLLSFLFLIHGLFKKTRTIPKISIFLPIYNMQNYIGKTLRLLQFQTLKDIEIIAVNDFSSDNTYEILKNYALKDKRIKIINNTKNSGLLYSRAMGILHSTGEYLLNLDPDDELNSPNDLKYLYRTAVSYNVDIISFNFLLKNNMKIRNLCDEFNHIIEQPKLFEFYQYINSTKDHLIWNKLIKKDIFLNAYKIFENYVYYKKWNFYEDNIWSLLVHKLARSKLCVDKLIYIYNNNLNESLMANRGNFIEFSNIVYKLDIQRKILPDNIYLKYISYECNSLIMDIKGNKNNLIYIESNEELKNLTFDNLHDCIQYYNISENNKKYVIDLFYNFSNFKLC